MALVWSVKKAGRHYEVRSAGHSLRLYTDGVFHSQWNSRQPLAGHLWDLLFYPFLFHQSPTTAENVLVLGLGGGAVVNVLNRFFSIRHMDVVDLDRNHIDIAERFFLTRKDNLSLIHQDATAFVKRAIAEKYDYLVEDLFLSSDAGRGDARRAIDLDKRWLRSLANCIKSGGVLAVNFESLAQLKKSLPGPLVKKMGFSSVYCFRTARYENAIAVLQKGDSSSIVDKRQFKARLAILLEPLRRSSYSGMSFELWKLS